MAEALIHMPDLMRQVTISAKVTGARRQAIRTRIGVALMLAAGKVIGCDINVETDPAGGAGRCPICPGL